MSDDLKPCPFCGSDDIQLSTNDDGDPLWVSCEMCECQGPWRNPDNSAYPQTEANYVEAWNRRAT